ncbi:MAG: polysaccharide pyruvyl transferase CsaB [Oscillospiraceae bacterium]|nr:polysaccharide pyruvyl transferase CsaB [Oscillospiraceae bacterium]
MRLMHLISGGDRGGAKTHVLTLLDGLRKTHDVRLVCFMDGEFADEARALGIETTILAARNPFAVVRALRTMLAEKPADVVHCHGARANMIGVLLKRGLTAPVVTTVHSDYRLDYLGRPLGRLTYGTINTVALRFLDSRICVSEAMARTLISRGYDSEKLFTIYNGVDFSPRTPKLSRAEYFASLGLEDWSDKVVFGIAARFSAVKDVATLIRGFGRAAKTCDRARLLLAGDGEQRAELEALAASCCPEGSYCFCGWVSDMDSFYAALDVNTLSSLSETFPYALTEGARARCATIASRVGGVPDLIQDGETGLLFEAKDDAALGEQIALLCRNEKLRLQLADALYERAKTSFSIEATVRRQTEIYETVVRRYGARGERTGIVLCGAYGRGNTGDDAILEAIAAQLRETLPDAPLTVLSRRPRKTAVRYRVRSVYTFDAIGIFRALRSAKLFLSGGGSLIQDATSNRSLWYYLWTIRAAKKRGCRVMMYGCGIGPVARKGNPERTARVLQSSVDAITLRESDSAAELARLGVTAPQITVTADPAMLLTPSPNAAAAYLRKFGVANERYAIFAPRPWRTMREHEKDFATAAKDLAETQKLRPILFAMQPNLDEPICRRIAAQIPNAVVVPAPPSGAETLGLLSLAEVVVSVRLHTLIFAAGVGTPMVGVSYDPKVTGFLRELGQGDCLQLETLTADALTARIESAMAGKDATAEKAARMREKAAQNAAIAAKLYRGENQE